MEAEDVPCLGYIAHVDSIDSILDLGILSYNEMKRLEIDHESVAEPTVQVRRDSKPLSTGGQLHDYANLYINPRNAMLFRVASRFGESCVVLAVDRCLLEYEGVRIVGRNAAVGTGPVEDRSVVDGLRELDKAVVYSRGWKHDQGTRHLPSKEMLMAEVLVPTRVQSQFIIGAWVPTAGACQRLARAHPRLSVSWDADLFFDLIVDR